MTATLRRSARVAACCALLLVLSSAATAGAPARASHARSTASWLAEVNLYRKAAGLTPVVDQPAWDLGLQHHLRYLALTPERYFTGPYQSRHTENPSSPYYTKDGAKEGGSSDLLWSTARTTAIESIDWWLRAPFHAIGMLRPNLRQVAFAYDSSGGVAGLDVINGLVSNLPPPTKPTLFPGPGVTTDLTTFGQGESPDPLQTCGWSTSGAYGLPLVVLLTQSPSVHLSATLTGPSNVYETNDAKDLCIVDAQTYRTTDPVYGPTGKAILVGDHAVFLISRAPLTSGAYTVNVVQPEQRPIKWSFHVQAPV